MEEDQRDIKAMKTAPIWRKRPSQGGCSRTSCVSLCRSCKEKRNPSCNGVVKKINQSEL